MATYVVMMLFYRRFHPDQKKNGHQGYDVQDSVDDSQYLACRHGRTDINYHEILERRDVQKAIVEQQNNQIPWCNLFISSMVSYLVELEIAVLVSD